MILTVNNPASELTGQPEGKLTSYRKVWEALREAKRWQEKSKVWNNETFDSTEQWQASINKAQSILVEQLQVAIPNARLYAIVDRMQVAEPARQINRAASLKSFILGYISGHKSQLLEELKYNLAQEGYTTEDFNTGKGKRAANRIDNGWTIASSPDAWHFIGGSYGSPIMIKSQSQSGTGEYRVKFFSSECTCIDWASRSLPCKHLLAGRLIMRACEMYLIKTNLIDINA